ncbi:MAG: uracil-DNA glycosylase [Clostridia bacterium]|nr:uracil-DNA glycosylase [Clostridia bacterium]
MQNRFGNDWDGLLAEEFEKDYMKELQTFLAQEYKEHVIFPPKEDIFNALRYTPYSGVKVLILGQDPYPGRGQAHGLSFSVRDGVSLPKSLQNIFKELQDDVGFQIPRSGCLEKWAKQGVMMLNTVLTVREGEPNSHKGKGWERFTDKIIELLNHREEPVIFVLWGANAKAKLNLITNPRNYVLSAQHPSPLSAFRGFLGCRHFSKINLILERNAMEPIDWQL